MREFFYWLLLGASGAMIGVMLAMHGADVINYWPFYLAVASSVLLIAFEVIDFYEGA